MALFKLLIGTRIMVGYNFKDKKKIQKFLLDLSLAEREGIGMWYEYLAKLRVYPVERDIKILVFGLPEKYGIGIDNLLFLVRGGSLTVIDHRPQVLADFEKITKNFLREDVNLKILNVKNFTKTEFTDNSFDLVCSSEVLQQFTNHIEIVQEMIRVSKRHIVFFVSNKTCYAHPKFSGLNSYSLKEIKNQLKKMRQIQIKKAGYADIPPWPSGINVTQNEKTREGFLINLVKNIFIFITPTLVRLEIFYPFPLRRWLAHFIYLKLEKTKETNG